MKSTKQKLKVGAVYCSPRHNMKQEDYQTLLQHPGERFIVGGDFNAKHVDWRSRLTITKGRELRKAVHGTGYNYHSTPNPPIDPLTQIKLLIH